MKYRLAATVAATIAALGLALAGCGTAKNGAAAHPSASAAVAHVKALATSPAVQAQIKKVAPKITTCAAQNGITLVINGAGTASMSAQVTHVNGTVMLHPVHTIEHIFSCAGLTPADVAKIKSYAESQIMANGFGHGSGGKDFTNIVTYAGGLMSGQAS